MKRASITNIFKINVVYILFTILMVVLNVIFIFRFKHQQINVKHISNVTVKKIENLTSLNEKLKDMIFNNLSSESSLLDPDLLLTDVVSKSVTKIRNIAQNSPVLVLRFAEYSCHVCVEQSLLKIQNLPHQLKPKKFIIIASYVNLRDLLLFKNDNDISYPIYTIMDDTLHVPLEDLNFPYFFILDKEHKATNIFYPLTSSPELTEDYFTMLKYKYPMLFR